jgi:uncharacterized protein
LIPPDPGTERDGEQTTSDLAEEIVPPAPPRPGTSTFTIEGKAAPALFVVGWLATIMGLGILLVSALAADGPIKTGLFVGAIAVLSIGLVAAAGSQGIERRAQGTAPFPGPSPVLVFVASIPLTVLLLVIVGGPLALIGLDLAGPPGSLLSVAVQALVYLGLVRILVVDTGALTWRAMGIVRPPARVALGEFLAGAVWALPVIGATLPILYILLAIFPVTPTGPLPPAGETVGFTIQLIAAAIVAPVGEELFFRAFATTAWVASLGVTRGVVRAALFFAFAHVLTISATSVDEGAALALIGFATRVPVSLVLGWLFVRRGSIWAPIGLHAAFNAILLALGEAAVRAA